MKKPINQVKVQGRVYDHNLVVKTVQNTDSANYGKDFISGTLDVATDDDCLNIVTVHYTFVAPTYPAKNGKPERPNDSYTALKRIIDSGKTILTDGKENATIVDLDPSIALNDFYISRNGSEELVSAKRPEGGFVNILNSMKLEEKDRSTFRADILINGTTMVEADEEKGIKEHLVVKGAIFDFRKAILPMDFKVYNPDGINYFENLDASTSNMTFTKVWGQIKSQNIVTEKTEESAFGGPAVTQYTRTVREWIIEGTSNPDAVYEIGDAENGITLEEVKAALDQRNLDLADKKKRSDDWKASQAAAAPVASQAGVSAAAGGFNF